MNERREIDGLELLATLSHELRNPLNAILGWATVLARRSDLPEPVTQGLQAIERNSRLQARMISDLLDYAAISAGEVRLAIEIIDPYPVVRAAIVGLAAAARDAGVAVEASFDDESLRIVADAARLQQIVGNLLSNAVKFSNRGKAVQLAAQRRGDCFRLVVSDQGKGIDPEFLPRIFDRFGRHRATTPRSHGGLGLGMPMVKQLAEMHSGTVRAQSAGKGQGATFILELPLVRRSTTPREFP
jgi:signal transduction histidine kinase